MKTLFQSIGVILSETKDLSPLFHLDSQRSFTSFRMTMIALAIFMLSTFNLLAADPIKVVTTTTTFESIAEEIIGSDAEYYSVAPPNRDIHFISPTPKDVLKTKKADVFIHGGLDLEIWRDPLLNATGRRDLINGEKAIDVSKGISLLEIPTDLSRAQGDIHLHGNPHYWIDPENAKIIADNIAEGLTARYPDKAAQFQKNAAVFKSKLDDKIKGWKSRLDPYEGTRIVTYHNCWPYFAKRFGFEIAGQLESKPGIPPTAKHLSELMKIMKEKNVQIIGLETFREKKTSKKVSKETGAKVVPMLQQVGEKKDVSDYVSLIEYNVNALESALNTEQGVAR
jgi:zinc/manganese transport system substrate-binding protein